MSRQMAVRVLPGISKVHAPGMEAIPGFTLMHAESARRVTIDVSADDKERRFRLRDLWQRR